MPLRLIRNDITKIRADAIVNTANPDPVYAGGTDHAIYMAAGAEQLLVGSLIGRCGSGVFLFGLLVFDGACIQLRPCEGKGADEHQYII